MLWLSFDGQRNVLELFSDNSYLSAILDRQGLLVAAQKETLEPRRLGNFSSQQLQVFWSKLKKKSPKIVVMSPTVTTKNSEHKEVLWQKSHALPEESFTSLFILFWPRRKRWERM